MSAMFKYYYSLFLFLWSLCLVTSHDSTASTLCHDSERYALLQLKNSFVIRESASSKPSSNYSKVERWGKGDCCAWEGVECNNNTGHVIRLDLSSSFLFGSIHSNSTLFSLLHLRSLNLSDNDFNGSNIPYGIANLSRLSHLDLSFSAFSGQIPSQLVNLSKLVVLHLSGNELELIHNPSWLRDLVDKLTNLEELGLTGVNISSSLPQNMGNLTLLTSLYLKDCSLHGEIPPSVFQLPNLQALSLRNNPYLTGKFPETFNGSSPLQVLRLSNTSLSGELPESFGTHLHLLSFLDIALCYFSGSIPSSIGQLTKLDYMDLSWNSFSGQIPPSLANLTHLTYLSLSSNHLDGQIPYSFGNLTKLTYLYLATNKLSGQIPSSLENLGQLMRLGVGANQLIGQIPSWLGNLTLLNALDLSHNKLQGEIPQSIFNLARLKTLYLNYNDLNGTLNFQSFTNLPNLIQLQLSANYLSLLTNLTFNATLPKFRHLMLGECNLSEFPEFLRGQDQLENLGLEGNEIHGQVPKWVWEKSKESLSYITLGGNYLTGFDQPIVSMNNLRILALDSNKLQGSIPIPPPSIYYYTVRNNSLTGEFPPLLCNLPSLDYLDLSYNNLSGRLPQCLTNLSESVSALQLRNNNFVGPIPRLCMKLGSKLKMIDLNQNRIEGRLPRSLANCNMLESLIMGNNQLNDTFPFWLGKLPELKILILRHNRFHGTLDEAGANLEFPKLQIIDLSFNRFIGSLPSQHFENWISMKVADHSASPSYLQDDHNWRIESYNWDFYFPYSVTITSKGSDTDYVRVQQLLVAIDFSSNNFEGCIPESIGSLKALRLLNLSNNLLLSCHIPPSLGNLSNLEALDLSWNNLSGNIPMELVQLTFLAYLNVSNNNLSGQIPQGKQFATFDDTSFGNNPGLCGKPLSKKLCSSVKDSPTSDEDEEQGIELDWKTILIGFGGGLAIGVSIGSMYNLYKHEWFRKYVTRMQQQQHKRRRGIQRRPRN